MNLRERTAGEIVSKKVESLEPITVAGEYIFEVLKAQSIDSRHMPSGEEKESLPEYSDATPEIYIVMKDVESGKGHIHRLALAAFLKFSDLSKEDIKQNGVVKSEMDDYALLKRKDGSLTRIPAIEGDKEFEGVINIFSRFVSAIGMEEGTTPEDCAKFIGKNFKGTLVMNDFTNRKGEAKSRVKLKPSFYPVADAEVSKLKELATEAGW